MARANNHMETANAAADEKNDALARMSYIMGGFWSPY